jgi:hypothetical protein
MNTAPLFQRDRLVTASGEIFPSDDHITVDTTSGAVTLTLPRAANVRGRIFEIGKINAGANNITVQTQGTDTVDGAASKVWNTQFKTFGLMAVATAAGVINYRTVYSHL